ncbi:MAG: EAL domain-containing protein [Kofleriaceae bacterium]|nr:EAL domain-containing protein [Kofleriaceae bacterium]
MQSACDFVPGLPPTVLVVDDDVDMLLMQRRTLGAAGMTVLTAECVDQALMILQSRPVEVVVSDISMPGRDGLDLLRAIRPTDPNLPLIFVTGSASLESAMLAVDLGASHYLQKPVDTRLLRQHIQAAAHAYRAAQRQRDVAGAAAASGSMRGVAGSETTFQAALDSLELVVQPVMSAATGRRVGWEALVRSGERSLANPGALFAAAERLDLVTELGRRIRAAAAELISTLPEGLVFLNVHSAELLDDELYDPEQPLSRVAPRVVLDITERVALTHVAGVASRADRLRRLGFRIAVDDLGAGYAALAAIVELRPDVVKLDMSLIRSIHRDPVRQSVVSSVVDMCARLAMWTVAEGVETQDELAAVEQLGCDLVQGYHIGRPAPWIDRAAG